MAKNNTPLIKVGFCVAYDWEMLRKSVPAVYRHADLICFSLDKNRTTWSGNQFVFDEDAFRKFVREIDVDDKIRIYEDEFFSAARTPLENDNHQRLLMSRNMGAGGWHIQIDSDEYFLDFEAFVQYLIRLISFPTGNEKPVNVCCNWISIYKKVDAGYLLVDNSSADWETMPFATNVPEYTAARRNSHFNLMTDFFVLHETWSRSREELQQKLNAWGHDKDFTSKESYFNFWLAIDEKNYRYVRDFHPLQSGVWHKLLYVKGDKSGDLLEHVRRIHFGKSKSRHIFTNSRNFHRVVALLKKLKIWS